MKEFIHTIGAGTQVCIQSICVLGSWFLSGMCLYGALNTAGLTTILYFLGFVVALAAGTFGLWAIGTEVSECKSPEK